ncbi:MAG: TIR domain-containing protein [Cyanobacteria bacterium P01_F01_bin.53]
MTDSITYFISYSRVDEQFALDLAKKLRNSGAKVWIDQIDIQAGDRWDEAIEDALEGCDGFLILLSDASVKSNNVMDEVSYALEEGKQVIPILVESCEVPFRLRRLQYIDLYSNFDEGFSRLLQSLELENVAKTLPGQVSGGKASDQGSPGALVEHGKTSTETKQFPSLRKTLSYISISLVILGVSFGTVRCVHNTSSSVTTLQNGQRLNLDDLKGYLEANDFRSANRETRVLLFNIANISGQDYFEKGDSQNIDCRGLEAIDKLWAEYSDGEFGIDVQKDILRDVQDWSRFIQKNGWEENGRILEDRSELTYDRSAPRGHLPGVMFWIRGDSDFYGGIQCNY